MIPIIGQYVKQRWVRRKEDLLVEEGIESFNATAYVLKKINERINQRVGNRV